MKNSANEIKKLWLIKAIADNSVLELRAIKGNQVISKIFKGSEFSLKHDLQLAFEKEALRLNTAGFNIFHVMNPIRDDFNKSSVKDSDIKYRDLMLIDIDKVGHKGESSTDKELDAARELSEEIISYLRVLGWEEPIRMMSGNGYHLYYVLNRLPNDETTKNLIEGALSELAIKFNTSTVAVDTVVFNASRITKVPGTIARKGENTAERPHRMAVVE